MSFESDLVKIRPYSPTDRERVLEIHGEAFRPVAKDRYEECYLPFFLPRLTPERTLVAEIESNVEGFVSFQRGDETEFTLLTRLIHALTCATYQISEGLEYESRLIMRTDKIYDKTPNLSFGNIRVNPLSMPPDMIYGTHMAVTEDLRGFGVGTSLAKAAYERARELEAPLVIASTITESPIVDICLKIGLDKVVTYGPHFPDGSSTTILAGQPKYR